MWMQSVVGWWNGLGLGCALEHIIFLIFITLSIYGRNVASERSSLSQSITSFGLIFSLSFCLYLWRLVWMAVCEKANVVRFFTRAGSPFLSLSLPCFNKPESYASQEWPKYILYPCAFTGFFPRWTCYYSRTCLFYFSYLSGISS